MHTILGAGGVIGQELSRELDAAGVPVRQVSRTPRAFNASDEIFPADLLDSTAVSRAVQGSQVAYLTAGLQYDTEVWQEQWPRLMRNVIDACKQHGSRLVFFDNVYAYGRVRGVMTEETPYAPVSRKGDVRARIARLLEEEIQSGELEGMIVRGADFYGPRAVLSVTHATVVERLRANKSPQWLGDPRAIHTFTYTPDAGRALAVLGRSDAAYGQTWHAPTSKEAMTGERFVRLACDLAGRPYRLQNPPGWVLNLMGLFVPMLRENREMMYQFDHDYRFDSSKIEAAYGVTPTRYEDGLRETLRDVGIPAATRATS